MQQQQSARNDIAIVGMACRFPGAGDYHQFWENLSLGVNAIKEVPKERWDVKRYYSPDINEPNRSVSKWVGLVDQVDRFDNEFFNLSPREANNMDPQQRLLLEETWHCFEDAGIPLQQLQQKRTSTYVGVMAVDYRQEAVAPDVATDSYACLGGYECILANRISYAFNLHGPSMSLNGACASSLVAIHEARRSLMLGESDYAIAAGVSLNLHPWKYISFSKSRMLSPDGQCKTFDKEANGYVPGDGVGVVLLMRLEDAQKAGHHIYGVIKGTAVNHGGKALSITAPRVEAQQDVILSAYREAGISPATVTYIEAHGTGTSLGDPIEVEALTRVFRAYTERRQFCHIGSVKSNIGHLEAAAGVAGLIKLLLMMKNKQIAKTINVSTLNPIIPFENSPFVVATETTEWSRLEDGMPFRAGVSSFGFGGANSHVVVEEYSEEAPSGDEQHAAEPDFLFALSAKTEDSLRRLLNGWKEFLGAGGLGETKERDMALTLLTGRDSFAYRFGGMCSSKEQLLDLLASHQEIKAAKPEQDWCLRIGDVQFSGYEELKNDMERHGVFRAHIQHLLRHLAQYDKAQTLVKGFARKNWPLSKCKLYRFIASYAYIATLLDMGFAPKRITGEASGIWVCLTASGIVTPADAIGVLTGNLSPDQICFSRPSITFLDPVTGQDILPYRFAGSYLKSLREAVVSSAAWTDEALTHYVQKAQLLVTSQFTFKKNLEEWNGVLRQAGLDLPAMLREHELLFLAPAERPRAKGLLLTVIVSALQKLNQKWNLREEKRIPNDQFYELVNLVVADILPKEQLVALLTDEHSDTDALAALLNGRMRAKEVGNLALQVTSAEPISADIPDRVAWLEKVTAGVGSLPVSDAYFTFGPTTQPLAGELLAGEIQATACDLRAILFKLWLAGVNVQWSVMYPETTFRKTPLPVYAFDRGSSFWFPHQTEATAPLAVQVGADSLHPLLDKNTSTLEEQKFSKLLTGQEFYMADHVVAGQKVLPGVAYIEMARAAGELAGLNGVRKLSQVVWTRPVSMDGAQAKPQEINTSLRPDSGGVAYEVWSQDGSQTRRSHARGKLLYGEGTGAPVAERLDLNAIRGACRQTRSVDECYRLLATMGLQYGPSFRPIREFVWSENEALARLELPAGMVAGFAQFNLHPTLLDGALQTAVALAAGLEGAPGDLFLPFAVEEVEQVRPLTQTCFAHVKAAEQTVALRKFDLVLTDEAGTVLVHIRQLSLRAANRGSAAGARSSLYLRPVWQKSELAPGERKPSVVPSVPVLLFDTGSLLRDELVRRLEGREEKAILVLPGTGFRSLGSYTYAIDPANPKDYRLLLETLRQHNIVPEHVLHLWSTEPFDGTDVALDRQLTHGLYSVFHLTQALMEQKGKSPVQFLYAYASPAGSVQPQYAAVGGFAKVLRLENPKFCYRTAALPVAGAPQTPAEAAQLLDWLLPELLVGTQPAVRFDTQGRWVKAYEETEGVSTSGLSTMQSVLKHNGVYLITGGAGGLGLLVAEFLAKRVQARLVLTGRSPLSVAAQESLRKLQTLGAEVLYVQADMTDRRQVEALVADIRARFGELNGILHGAGVLHDSYLLKKTQADMVAVLAPKLYGTVYLDECTRTMPLDFFVMFSSFVAETGNLGQADYAFANSFMDHYAFFREQRRTQGQCQGRTVSVNWPLWESGGMRVDSRSEQWMLDTFGLEPLATPEGLAALATVLEAGQPQVLVLPGNTEAIKRAFGVDRAAEVAEVPAGPVPAPAPSAAPDRDRLRAQMVELLKEILAATSKNSVQRINSEEPFEKYGIDSVMIMDLTRELELRFGELSKTLFFEYQNIAQLAAYFVDNHEAKLTEMFGLGPEPPRTTSTERMGAGTATVAAAEPRATIPAGSQQRFLQPGAAPSLPEAAARAETDDIAIIGVAGRYPMADTLEQYFDLLKNGKDCVTEIPADRWAPQPLGDFPQGARGKNVSKWGGFLNGVDQFDPLFFNISPKEAELIDPQERLFLETVYHAVEDGGYMRDRLAGAQVGVFVGVMYGQYQFFGVEEAQKGNVVSPGSLYASIANRISYFFNFHGPSIALDTMCSSSLTAIHLACESLRRGETDFAIAGGVNVSIHPYKYQFLSQNKFLSSDGRCRSFGEGGDGYVPGEGVGALLLKPLKKAVADGDRIYAVIKGSALNHGGKVNGYYVPNPNAQGEVILEAIRRAKIDPRTISYVEAHGTGTSLGDPIEIAGLTKAFGAYTKDKQFCAIGSVKSNIGHLESAAGVAAVTKVLLQLKHRQLVPSVHSDTLNPNINFKDSPFYVQRDLAAWNQPVITGVAYPRRAGISSFGAGGANAHLILEEYVQPVGARSGENQTPQLVLLSAKNPERLRTHAEQLVAFLERSLTTVTHREIDQPGLRKSVKQELLQIVADILHVTARELDADEPLADVGLDPVGLLAMTRRIQARYGIDLPDGTLIGYASVGALAAYLCQSRGAELMEHYPQHWTERIETVREQLRLDDIAYTLLGGREAMEERLAVIASSVAELKERLVQYVQGVTESDRIFSGNSKADHDQFLSMLEGNEGGQFLNSLLQSRKLDKLAQLWVSGADVDLLPLIGKGAARLVSLPGYPFANEHYWVPTANGRAGLQAGTTSVPALHPLIDSNESSLEEIVFHKTFSVADLSVLEQVAAETHRVSDTAQLEMLRAAASLANHQRAVLQVKQMVFGAPITVGDRRNVQIRLQASAQGVRCEIASAEPNGQRSVHAQAEIVYADGAQTAVAMLDTVALTKRLPETVEAEECHRLLVAGGWQLPADRQVVQRMLMGEREALAQLALPVGSGQAFGSGWHPALLDGALQAARLWLHQKHAVAAAPHYVLSVGEAELSGPMPEKGYAHITLADQDAANGSVALHIELTDETGLVAGTLHQVKLMLADLTVAGPATGTASVMLVKTWQEQAAPEAQARPAGAVIILANQETATTARQLFAGLPSVQTTVVQVGSELRHNVEGEYFLDGMDPEQGSSIARVILQSGQPITGVIDLSDLHVQPVGYCQASLGKITLLQEILKEARQDDINLLHFTTGLQTFLATETGLAGADLAGLVKMLGAEYRRVLARTIDVDLPVQQAVDLHAIVLREWAGQDGNSEICYRQGKRYVPQMRPVEKAAEAGKQTPIDRDKVYVITGGTRGIGAEVARHLVRQGARNLVLMGVQAIPPRSEWNSLLGDPRTAPSLAARLRSVVELEAQGVSVELYAGSLTDKAQLQTFFAEVRQRRGAIGGVVHAAGLTLNEHPAFINKTSQEMAKVFEPKIAGLQTLHELLQADRLEFFVLFSSVSGTVPVLASGLSDYGTANAFMDAFAAYQHSRGYTCYQSIQWPSWKEVGMGEVTSAVYVQLGLTAHTTAEGLALLDQAMRRQDLACVMPAVVKQADFDAALLLKTKREPKLRTQTAPVTTQSSGRVAGSASATIDKLKQLFAAELKIPQARLDVNTTFADFGVDSILLSGLVKQAEQAFAMKVDPGLFLEYPTLKLLGEYLQQRFRADSQASSQAPEATGTTAQAVTNAQLHHALTVRRAVLQPLALAKLESGSAGTAPAGAVARPIAVIGIACHFPGAPDKEAYWRNLAAGRSSIVEVPKLRWDTDRLYAPVYAKDKSIGKWGGFIEGIEYFDPAYFQISEEDAPQIDPLVRQFLEVSAETFCDAGYEKSDLWNRKVGVFVGSRVGNYSERVQQMSKNSITGIGQNFIAAHVSHLYNLRGPNLVIDSACSSSLVSIHLACQSIVTGESEMALAGGVDILLDEKPYLILSQGRALSPDGKCHTFDEKANGFVPGEGCGAVLLKPLEKAMADGDRIYAVIDSTAVNNDGNTMGITTPNPEAQAEVIRQALDTGRINPNTVTYVEAHGTGTMIGDPIELKALTRVFREWTDEKQFCAIGSVKSNFGHALSAAGIASFIKVALSLHYKQLPPTLNCETPNPRFEIENSPFFPNTELRPWAPREGVYRAGISSFGFGGTNAHVLVSGGAPGLLDSYQPKRVPLAPISFNRKRYWLDNPGRTGKTEAGSEVVRPPKANLPSLLEFVEER